MLTKLAAAEAFANDPETASRAYTDGRAYSMLTSYPIALTEKMAAAELEACRAVEPGTLVRERTKRACILSFPAFCQYLFGREDAPTMPLVKQAAMFLPGIFGDMAQRMMIIRPHTSLFAPSSEFMAEQDSKKDDLVQNVMDAMEDKFSVKEEPMKQRVTTVIIRVSSPRVVCRMVKAASAAPAELQKAAQLAEVYGQYQVRALCDMKNLFGEQVENLCDVVVGSNSGIMFDNF